MASELGTVISTFEGPNTRKFSFVIKKGPQVRRGQFVSVKVEGSTLIARVADIRKTNRYFMNPESVKSIESVQSMAGSFPTWEWEYLVADCEAIGVFDGNGFADSNFPPSPGDSIVEPDPKILEKFFGFDRAGIFMGRLKHHDIEVRLNPTRLLQKHLALLSISGGGKSYSTAVLIEELLDREIKNGTLAVIVLDTHGEYTSFANDKTYAAITRVFPISEFRIGMPNLSPYRIAEWTSLSGPQERSLSKILNSLGRKSYSISDVISAVENSDTAASTKDVLITVLEELRRTGLFGVADYPPLEEMAQLGRLCIMDLSETVSSKKRQLAVAYTAGKLFEARRNGIIPPFLLVIEEAHQYAPEKARREHAIAKNIISTIAREGRKFGACLCLISQRPVQLSATVLSQCNTNIIMRVRNPYDLDHIGESSEGISRDVLDQISSLGVGTGLIVGEATNFPLFVKIRDRRSRQPDNAMPLEKLSIKWHEGFKKKSEDAKAFM